MDTRGTVLLLGATGFIGRRLLEVLRDAGYGVVCGVRDAAAIPQCRCIPVDFMRDQDEADWLPRLAGVDFVINAVGILRESSRATFDSLHVAAPVAVFRASASAGVKKIVQISALGADDAAVSRYHLSKKRADDALAALDVPWLIVQPALFTRLAAYPVVPVPGDGSQQIQPVHIDDLTAGIVRLLDSREHERKRIAA